MWDWIGTLLEWLGLRKRPAVRWVWWIDGQNGERDGMLLLTIDQQVTLRVQPVDRLGNAARVDGVPVWALSNPDVAALAVAADGLSAVFTTTGLGVTQVSVSADADLGSGVRTIAGTLDVQVESGEAVSLAVLAGTPAPKG